MPSLQLHMYRVAGVGQIIAESCKVRVNMQDIIKVGLFHDLGNIIKFNLDLFPEFLEPEGREYWEKVQNEYFAKYGHDEHAATMAMAKEIGINSRIEELLQSVGFSRAESNYQSSDMEKKIVMYADMRVEPHGVVSLERRLADGRKRWKINKPGERGEDSLAYFEKMAAALRKMKKQIFSQSTISPEDITDEVVNKKIKILTDFEI